MSPTLYHEVARSFDWAAVHRELGWTDGKSIDLGRTIIDRRAGDDRTALIWIGKDNDERRISYRELSDASSRFANLLKRLEVEKGDCVAALMPRIPEVLVAMLGALKIGAIYVPIFTGFAREAVRFRIAHSGAKVIVTHSDVRDQIPTDLGVTVVCVGSAGPNSRSDVPFETVVPRESPAFPSISQPGDETAAIIYTSGSTGPPKGGAIAVNFLAAVWPYIKYGAELRPDDVFWPTGDPGWGYGFVCYLGALAAGVPIVSVQAQLAPELCLSVIERYHVTNLGTTPTLLRGIMALGETAVRAPSTPIRTISSCGEPLNGEVVEFFRRVRNVTPLDHFGATEYALPIGNYACLQMEVKPGSMGLPAPGFRMAVVDDNGRELPTGEVGFIGKKIDPNCLYWLRYWEDEASTQKLLHNGWIATGDLARRDEDGYFWFEGRADDVIKSAGYRIGPFEIESALLKHPSVAETAVIGKPDALKGQIVKAFVVLRRGATGTPSLADELVNVVKQTVGRHEAPREIEFVDSLPKTQTGKIQRFLLRQRTH